MALLQRDEGPISASPTELNWPRIADYAIIGDCRSAALIATNGAVEWLCWPRFDSPSIFGAILDRHRGGTWKIAPRPADILRTHRTYIEHSNVLRTTFECRTGTVTVTDLMPVATERAKRSILTPDHELLRRVECVAGEVQMYLYFQPRPEYGSHAPHLRTVGVLGVSFVSGDGVFYLRSSIPLTIEDGVARASWTLRLGDSSQFSFTYGEESPVVLPPLGDWTRKRIGESTLWWCHWAAQASYDGPYRNAILRSALTLKLLSYAPSGAIMAAATTSLPEHLKGALNWDYRYCWLRDASLTVRALLGLGYRDEAASFIEWMLYATRLTQPELRILYTAFGTDTPLEKILPHLSGYMDSRPVRIGNAARHQLQLDVYGEVMDAVAQYGYNHGTFVRSTQKLLIDIGKHVAKNWNQPDQGIWEPREHPQHHTHSRVLCWVTLDRLITLQEKGHLKNVPVDDFCRERDRIAAQIREQAWNPTLNSYVSVLGGNKLDASLLLMSYYGFEAADSDRMRATYAAIRRELRANDHLIYRYQVTPKEGAFGICSFWEVDYLALGGGTIEQAQRLFDDILQYQNDVGLFAEEIDPDSGQALGNFPQAFTHVGLISAALSITERLKGEKQLAHRESSAQERGTA
jgi:GH15 family glucan-1,4-alpha-glucosidase